jgi:hypothetical protein
MKSRTVLRIEGVFRYMLARNLLQPLGAYLVTEFPKSGGSWIGLMISDALQLPFPRHRMPRFGPSFLHGHYRFPAPVKNTLVVWRDPRDIMVSWYYHCTQGTVTNPGFMREVRRDLKLDDYDDVRGNLPAFIEYSFTRQRSPRFSWNDFYDCWWGREDATAVRYEDFLADCVPTLQAAVRELAGLELSTEKAAEIADRYSFRRMSGRTPGQENASSFLRKGVAGDWRTKFTPEAAQVLHAHTGDRLVEMGYESDPLWHQHLLSAGPETAGAGAC